MKTKLSKELAGPVKINRGGVRLNHQKINTLPEKVAILSPNKVRIPLQMHLGAECKPTVKVREQVKVGQLIADSEELISSPIHASISGIVKSIQIADENNSGSGTTIIEIESDGKMTPYENLTVPQINSKEDFLREVRKSGLVGLGGAGFPTSVKLTIDDVKVDTLIANGAECEPYIAVDDYKMRFYQEDILDAMLATMKWIGISHGIIAIEDNKMEAANLLLEKINHEPQKYADINIVIMNSVYPKGAEKLVIYNATGRTVPRGKLPKDIGCIVMNTTSLAELGKYLRTGMPLVDKLVTVDGSAVSNPQNVNVPIGSLISDLLTFVGLKDRPDLVMMGGPMMGIALSSLENPVVKQNNAIIAMLKNEFQLTNESACIRCAKCVDVCPMRLQPTNLVRAIKKNQIDKAKDDGLLNCIGCGSCDYICPAKIPLAQYLLLGKSKLGNNSSI
ncbi:MAG TPA: electron transport complex subunit RsxC [Clostridiaceae bacterium]|nr:electron transport complex subunit RsxC [Clostridiaceae bacterium]